MATTFCPALRANNYQASPSQGREIFSVRSSSEVEASETKARPLNRGSSRVLLQCCPRFQRWRSLDEEAAPNTY